jgi:hypothetical protein
MEILMRLSILHAERQVQVSGTPLGITGKAFVCPMVSETYTAPLVSGAVTYNWMFPPGWLPTVVSGNSNIATITTGGVGQSGTVTVQALNASNTLIHSFSYSVHISAPIAMIGMTEYCSFEEVEAALAALTALNPPDPIMIDILPSANTAINQCLTIQYNAVLRPMGANIVLPCLEMEGAGKVVKLMDNLTVTNLALTNGFIRTNGHQLKVSNFTGGSSSSFVITD